MDFSKLKTTDWLIGGGAILFLVSMFLPWYKAEAAEAGGFGFSVSVNGFHYALFGYLPLILILAVFFFLVLPKLAEGVNPPEQVGPMPKAQAALIAAAVAAALVVLRLLLKDGDDGFGIEIKRGIGLFIATIAALAVAAGALLRFQGKEEIGSGGGDSTAPPTPF